MPALKIGVQLASLRLPLKKGLELASRWGVQGIELDVRTGIRAEEFSQTALRQLRKLMDDLKLTVAAVSYPTRRGYNVPDRLEQRIAGTKTAMKLAQSLGARVVINHVGHIPAEAQGPQWELLLQSLSDLGRQGQHYGAILAADTGAEDPATLAKLIDALPAGSLGVNLNPGNLISQGYSTLDAVSQLGTHIFHVYANDGVRDLGRGRGVETALGRGSVDFPALLGALEERDYRGFFTLERRTADDPVYELSQGVEYLRAI